MPASIGVNLRVTGNCRQGGRKYMEDCFSVAYQQTEDEKDLEYAFFGIYDGHGGVEAASFAKEHLMETIIKHKNFWSDNDEDVLRAIKDGYIATHYAMWREQSKWPRTSSGLPSTAGTTASVAFIRRGKIYIGHVGDSGIILGYQEPGSSEWKAKPLTRDHKPENPEEMKRIESCGGKVVPKSGVPRVVWNRPKIGHQGPVRRSTPIDEIPFLAVARSLGDLWSYNSQIDQFVVSPDPDCSVLPIDTNIHRCLIFGTDGLFNMLSPGAAVFIVQQAERHNECEALSDDYNNKVWLNPSKLLVERALDRWQATKLRADNTSAVTLMLDPPGPPRAQVLKDRKKNLPQSGLKIMTRYNENASQESPCNQGSSKQSQPPNLDGSVSEDPAHTDLSVPAPEDVPQTKVAEREVFQEKCIKNKEESSNIASISSSDISSNYPLKERNFVMKGRESTSFDPREPYRPSDAGKENNTQKTEDNTIQINEISSSNIEDNVSEEEGCENDISTGECSKESKCTLRSSSKKLAEQEKKTPKRKLESEEAVNQQRKSLRLNVTQKFLEDTKKPAPCTVAEEKLKRLAEEAEKSKSQSRKNSNGDHNTTKKLSITQKILKSKQVSFKKKALVKKPFNKQKIKIVFETVLVKTSKKKTNDCPLKVLERPPKEQETSTEGNVGKVALKVTKAQEKDGISQEVPKSSPVEVKKSEPLKKVDKGRKIISNRVSNFKRQSMRNASQKSKESALKKVSEKSKLVQSKQQPADNAAKTPDKQASVKTVKSAVKETKSEKSAVEIPRKGKLQVLNSIRETRSSPGIVNNTKSLIGRNGNDAKENIKAINLKGIKNSSSRVESLKVQPSAKVTLRQRIQDKTKTLKKSVLKKAR